MDEVDEPAVVDQCRGRREIGSRLAISVEMRHCSPNALVRIADARPRFGAGHQAKSVVERLGSHDQLDGQDPFDVLEHHPGVSRRDRAHRDMVLLVGRRRDAVGRGRMGEHLVLRYESGGRVLEDHQP